jgi:lipopolysaccharide/colanic/teichoic acid biosynthesis glycosyltransferase
MRRNVRQLDPVAPPPDVAQDAPQDDWQIELRQPGRGRRLLVVGPRPQADGAAARLRLVDGHLPDLAERLRAHAPDEVWFDVGSALVDDVLAGVAARLLMDGVAVHLVLPEHTAPRVRAVTARLGAHDVISLQAVRDGGLARAVRRVADVVAAVVLLAVLSPLLAVAAVAIAVAMGRPVLHAHTRLGQGGRRFRCFKFRSMVRDAEARLRSDAELYREYVESNFKLPPARDPRLTPLGRLLRRTSVDELPQLWNVLRGEMTLVGPRPIVPEELVRYGDYGRMLLRVKPGLTGLWQVSGRSDIAYPERARLDLEYLATRSLGRDVQLLLRTLPAVLLGRGAV